MTQPLGPSDHVRSLYTDMYANDIERELRDAGARDKVANIIEIWRRNGCPPRPRVVELGCGEGAIAAALVTADFPESYTGYDISESGIEAARARQVPGATFVHSDGSQFDPSGGADLVVLTHVVEHLEHPRAILHEARRLAEWTVVEVPLELNSRTPRDYVWDDLGHINKYTSTSIRHLLQTSGFTVVDQMTTHPSKDQELFGDTSRLAQARWQVKDLALRASPRLARTAFTYHETLLARRS